MTKHLKQIKWLTSLTKENVVRLYHEELDKSSALSSQSSTSAATELERKDLTSYRFVTIRKDAVTVGGLQCSYHRIFIKCDDSKDYYKTGWILEPDIPFCMICQTSFISVFSFTSRHHCRACGNVICSTCSPYTALVSGIEDVGVVRVCRLCYFGQETVNCHNSLLDGEALQGIIPNENHLDFHSPTSNNLPLKTTEPENPELTRVKRLERILLEKEVSELTINYHEFDEDNDRSVDDTAEENHFLTQLKLRDYGKLSIQVLTPHYVLKLSSRGYNKVTTPNSRSRNCLFVNICSCSEVPMTKKPFDPASANSTELFGIVFGPIIEGGFGNFIMDCAVNPQLIQECDENPVRQEELFRQVTVGVSFYRNSQPTIEPFYQSYEKMEGILHNYLSRGTALPSFESPSISPMRPPLQPSYTQRLRENYSEQNLSKNRYVPSSSMPTPTITTSTAPLETIVLAIPAKDCVFTLHYVYTKYADLSQPDRTKHMTGEELQQLLASLQKLEKDYVATIQSQLSTLRRIQAGSYINTTSSTKGEGEEGRNSLTEVAFDNDHNHTNERTSSGEKHVRFSPELTRTSSNDHTSSKKERRRFSALLSSMVMKPSTATTAATTTSSGTTETAKLNLDHTSEVDQTNTHATERKLGQGKIIQGVRKALRNSLLVLPSAQKTTAAEAKNSIESTWYWEERGTTGQKLITREHFTDDAEMNKINYNQFRSAKDSIALKNEVIRQPNFLLGWKIAVQRADFTLIGVYIVTGLTQMFRHGLVFRISHPDRKDAWVKLNFVEGDSRLAYPFVLIEKMVDLGKK